MNNFNVGDKVRITSFTMDGKIVHDHPLIGQVGIVSEIVIDRHYPITVQFDKIATWRPQEEFGPNELELIYEYDKSPLPLPG